jgi:hypothetical protein
MADVIFLRRSATNNHYVIGETPRGRKWTNKVFGKTNEWIQEDELESYIDSAKEHGCEVECY